MLIDSPPPNYAIYSYQDVSLDIPVKSFKKDAVEVTTVSQKSFMNWTPIDHQLFFHLLRKVTATWNEKNIGNQYLVYGKQDLVSGSPFSWQVMPYQKTNGIFSRMWQQIVVLWRIVFGGFSASKEYIDRQLTTFKDQFTNFKISNPSAGSADFADPVQLGNDAFCNPETIERQSVFEGRKVRILYNYAPIGLGGDRLHFLVIPKRHVSEFNQLSDDEFVEMMDLSQKLITHFKTTRNSQEVHLMWKEGKDAGQTVAHPHLQMIFAAKKAERIWGQLTVLKNIVWGSSPMPAVELKRNVDSLRKELNKN